MSMPVGGAEDIALSLTLTKIPGLEILPICLSELGVAGKEAIASGLPISLLPVVKGRRFNPVGAWRLSRWMKEQRIDIAHSHVYNAHVYAVIAAQLAGIPSVMHHHKTFNYSRRRRWLTLRMLAKLSAAQITLSEKTREDIITALRVPREITHVMTNAIDTGIFYPAVDRATQRQSLGISTKIPLVGSIASLTPQKNHTATVRMMALMKKTLPECCCMIFGEGMMRQELEVKIAKFHVEQVLKLAGNKRPIAPWLQSLDVLTLPSLWEGQPMVLLQGMACRVPIVASDIEGNATTLGANHPGLFKVNDDYDYLEKTRRCLTDSSFREKIIQYQDARWKTQPKMADYDRYLYRVYNQLL